MTQQAPSERITLLFEKFSGFVDGYGGNLSLGGMFLETEDHREVGSIVDFAVKLTDGFQLLYGLGEVVWTRHRAGGPDLPAGLGIRFQALDDSGRELILRILEERVRSGFEPFDVEEVPPDVAGLASDTFEQPVGDDPFPTDEPQPVESKLHASDAASSTPSSEVAGISPPHPVPPDVEKKILGEDGFTLLDSEQREPDPVVVQNDKTFEELAFDAPWGEKLPELPEEVLEEDSFVTASEDSAPTPAVEEVSEPSFAAEEVPEPTFAAEELTEPSFGAEELPEASFAAEAFPEESFAAEGVPEPSFGAEELPEASFAAEAFPEESFAAEGVPEPSFAADEVLESSFGAEASAKEVAEDSYAAKELATFVADGASDPSFALEDDEDPGLLQGASADFGSGGSVDEDGEQDALEASLYLAAQAADEIDTTPPADEVFDEPDFHEIDFGATAQDDLPVDVAPGAVSEDFAFEPDSDTSGAPTDFAFEPDPKDQLPPLEMDSLGTGGDASDSLGSPTSFEEDATLLTSDRVNPTTGEPFVLAEGKVGVPPATDENSFALTEEPAEEPAFPGETEDDPFALHPSGVTTGGSTGGDPFVLEEEDATLVGASDQSSSPLDSEDATVVGAGAPGSVDSTAPPPTEAPWGAPVASFEDLAEETPPLASADAPSTTESVPETPSLWAPGGFGSGSEAEAAPAEVPAEAPVESTVTVAGAPADVQDYEDDLFADSAEAGSGQVARRALSGKMLALVALLALAATAGYFFQDPLLEWVGSLGEDSAPPGPLGPPPAESVASPSTPAGAIPDTDRAEQPSDGAATGEEPEATAGVEAAGDPEGGTMTPELEEVDVAETLPSGGATAGDPEANPDLEPPAIEAAGPALAPSTPRASRIQGITWRQVGEGTQVIVKLDGTLDESDYLHMPLGYNPAREMVKLTGIAEPYAAGQVEVGSPELLRIRTGYHVKAEGPELHVVFDFPAVGPRVTGVRHLGDRLEILIARP